MKDKKFNIKGFFKERMAFMKAVFDKWNGDNCFGMSAALSYYTIFSLAPILIIVISIAGYFFGREAVTGEIYGQIKGLIGAEGALGVQNLVEKAYLDKEASLFAKIIGGITLVVSATATFSTLQGSLNTIWEVKPKPDKNILHLVMARVMSFALLTSIAFLLMVSLIISAALSILDNYIARVLSEWSVYVIGAIQFAVSFGVITVLFALIFKVLPDVKMKWGDLWRGAVVTSALFTIGKFLIGLYLGQSDLDSTYGAAASIIVIILWVNYSSLIFFFGAEYIFMDVRKRGSVMEPTKNAMKVIRKEIEFDHDRGTRTEIRHGRPVGVVHERPAGTQ